MSRKVTFSLSGILTLLLGIIPSATAAPFDGVSQAMGTAWSAIGSVFSFDIAPGLQEGVLKFLIFILLLRVVMSIMQKLGEGGKAAWLDTKTSGIIGFVVAAVTVWFTPNVFIFSSIILLLVPIAIALGTWYWAFKGSTEGSNAKKAPPAMAAIFLLILLILLQFLDKSVYRSGSVAVQNMLPFTSAVMDLLILVTGLLFVWKLFSMIFTIGGAIGGGEGIVGAIQKAGEIADAAGELNKKLGRPGMVSGINIEQIVESPIKVKVSWDANPEPNIKEYTAEWSYARRFMTAWWIRIGVTKGTELEFGNIDPHKHIIVRVAAVNNLGMRGPWGTVRRTFPGQIGPMMFQNQLRDAAWHADNTRQALERARAYLNNMGALNADGTLKDEFPAGMDLAHVEAAAREIRTAQSALRSGLTVLEGIARDSKFSTINQTELSKYRAQLSVLRDLSLRLAFIQRAGAAARHEVS